MPMNLRTELPICKVNFLTSKPVENVRRLATTIGISLMCFCVHGQNYPAVNIVSPTASALGKYVDFPVSLHTGVPEVNIPIYTVQEGPLQLPISLSYHASGLQVMELASWVGAGWSLNVGGVVSRSVKGTADETVINTSGRSNSFFSDGGFSNYLISNEVVDYSNFSNGRKDGEPDLFTFSFGGQSGKFYFREDNTPILFPQGDLKIEPILKQGVNTEGMYDYIQGFKIVTPDGVKYFFGVTSQTNDVDPIEKSSIYTTSGGLPFSDVVSSWYLHKIQSADSKFEINISYRKEDYGYVTISTKPCIPDCNGSVAPIKIIMSGVVPQQIQFTTGYIDFVPGELRQDVSRNTTSIWDELNNSARWLNEIKISSNQTAHCVSHKFSFDYFTSTSQNLLPYALAQWQGSASYVADKKRLKLNSIQESSCDASELKPPYSFSYYDEGSVPRRLSFGQDHWGFYNGVESNTTLIPPTSANAGASYGAGDDREAKWPQMRAGALRIIQYPTGGGTEYIYEPNSVETVNCSFQRTYNTILNVQGGMDTPNAGFGPPATLVVTTPSAYYYYISTSGTNAAGSFYIDNKSVATVSATGVSIAQDYLFLQPGTYTIKAYASADNGGGVGVIAYLYSTTTSCDLPQGKIVGGLRIKKIDKFGGNNSQLLSMNYQYENASLYSIPDYIFKLRNEVFKTGIIPASNTNSAPEAGCPGSVFTYSSPASTQPLQTVQGYHIGYKKVTEIFPDGGYTVNEYKGIYNLPSNWNTLQDVCVRKIDVTLCNLTDPIYPTAPLPYDFERGNLKSRQVFDKDNRKIKEVSYSEEYEQSKLGVFGVATALVINPGLTVVTHYDIRTAKLNWTKQIEKLFDQNNNAFETETMTYFSSPYHAMPTKKTQTAQIGGITQTDYSYVSDLTKCNYECPSCAADYFAEADLLKSAYDVKDEQCKNGICPPGPFLGWPLSYSAACYDVNNNFDRINCRIASWNDYQYRLNQARIVYTNCIKSCKQNNNCVDNGINTNTNEDVKALYVMEKGNDLKMIESTLWGNNNLKTSTFLDYRSLTSDPTKVYLKNIFETEVNSPVSAFSPTSIFSGVIQRDFKYNPVPVSTYLFSEGQPVEIIQRNGLTTSYIWGFNNTVPIVKSVGSSYSTLNTAYINLGINLRNDPSLSKAQLSTYTYINPIVGITSVTDANGRLLTYEYDKLGRLIRIKDHDGSIIKQFKYHYKN
jgi:YD repeat-containing protein